MLVLSPEQQQAFDNYRAGKSFLVTGPGGTGKSALIRHIVEDALNMGKKLQVCAMTGTAADQLQCKARTIHSWAGLGLASGGVGEVVDRVYRNKQRRACWKKANILIIDEVSMMSAKLLNILDMLARKCRTPLFPFGGMQVIFFGDFYQLPPVGDAEDPASMAWAFEYHRWSEIVSSVIELKTVFRQNDPLFVKALHQVRVGRLTRSCYERLLTRVGVDLTPPIGVVPTKLVPTRRQADSINGKFLQGLQTEGYTFNMENSCDVPSNGLPLSKATIEYEQSYLSNSCLCEKSLVLKTGSQVMCVANIDMEDERAICNGSQGIVTGFVDGKPKVLFTNGRESVISQHAWISERHPNVSVKQVPLILAWAITIHKSQGATLAYAEVDVGSGVFECGQTYVALSRVKSLDGLKLTAFDPSKIVIDQRVIDFYKQSSTKN